MKDILGNELKVGDIVLGNNGTYYPSICVVVGFTDKMVKVTSSKSHDTAKKYTHRNSDCLIKTDISLLQYIDNHEKEELEAAIKHVGEVGDQSKKSTKPAKKSDLEI